MKKLTRCRLCGLKGDGSTLTSKSECASYHPLYTKNLSDCKDRQIAKLKKELRRERKFVRMLQSGEAKP